MKFKVLKLFSTCPQDTVTIPGIGLFGIIGKGHNPSKIAKGKSIQANK